MKDKIAEVIETHTGQTCGDYLAQAILDLIAKELPKEQLHRHNSIPNYYDNVDDGCYLCIRNQCLKDIKHKLGVE